MNVAATASIVALAFLNNVAVPQVGVVANVTVGDSTPAARVAAR